MTPFKKGQMIGSINAIRVLLGNIVVFGTSPRNEICSDIYKSLDELEKVIIQQEEESK